MNKAALSDPRNVNWRRSSCRECGRPIHRHSISRTGWEHTGPTTDPPCPTRPPLPKLPN